MDHSQSKLHYEFQKKKEKISNTTKQNDNTLETTKKKRNANAKTELGRTSIKISATHTIKQAVQWPTSVVLHTNTL